MRPSYGTAQPNASAGGRVAAVEAGSAADHAGLRAGDVVVLAEGEPIRDVIDWQWAASDGAVDIRVVGADGAARDLTLEREQGESFGIEFDGVVFDGVRECENACQFCFVAQLPAGLRAPLYVRDDDFRLSFLFGNFVTLTNLSDADVARIGTQRLSPLYVSLHAVDPDVRRKLVCATGEDTAVQRLDELLDAGIRFHVQIVLVPGVNDGEVLDETLGWLSERQGVLSVGVVPLGFTAHQVRYQASFGEPAAAAAVLEQLEGWQRRMHGNRGAAWVWPADEFYLAAAREVPSWDEYDDFPQYENGIGLVRAFTDELAQALAEESPLPATRPVTLVTGELFAPVLRALAPSLEAAGVRVGVLAVPNRLFGGNVSVTGLLSGVDIARAVTNDSADSPYLVPDIVVNSDDRLLDDVRPADLPALAHKDVRVVPTDPFGLVATLRTLAKEG